MVTPFSAIIWNFFSDVDVVVLQSMGQMFHCLLTAQVIRTTTYLTERTKFHQGLSLKVSPQPWSFREQQRLCWTDLCTPQPLANKRIALPHALFLPPCDLYKSQRWVHFTHFECQIQKPCNFTTLSLKGELVGFFFPLTELVLLHMDTMETEY